jgi:geranylgeranyl pyrophosphate synthase
MLSIAATGHRTLCLGQGDDLDWARHPHRLDLSMVLDIVRRKTAPPFEVALRLGSLAAGAAEPELHDVLREYSRAIGIAYQVRDDLYDLDTPGGPDDLTARRPSVLLALADKAAAGDPSMTADLQVAWQRQPLSDAQTEALRETLRRLDVEGLAQELLDDCKQQAVAAIGRAGEPALKALLRRLIGKIFYDVETMTCCTDRRDPNAGPARDHS